ncbi:MAG: PIN domain-containing protein [Gemmatimonadetes bacterium]|nr:PIN domain-containing protein [Gemmatimonadota bacterium]
MKLFLDITVVLDVLAKREPWFEDSATVLSLLDTDEFDGVVAAHSVATLFYLTAKELGRRRATARLLDLLKLVSVAPLDQESILKSLALGWPDFEDALQMLCADSSGADYLVTRNTQDFRSDSIPVVTPTELLAMLQADT